MMDVIPPPYEHAMIKDALAIVADYIPSADLCSASLVSRRWHAIFNPQLWGDPASHFGTENDAVYVALTRFKRTLKHVRPEVRNLTYTLHLPPALSEIYGGPRSEWLRDLLDYLPRLQSLRVSKLPFFDHNATTSLKVPSEPGQAHNYSPYNLRLLLAEGEPNTTSVGLATALSRFPALVYLDLSYTPPARDKSVLSRFSELPDLQVLKLRGIGLKDADVEFLANSIGTRVRLLDIRNNLLTDTAVRSLLQTCFMPKETAQDQTDTLLGRQGNRNFQDWTSALLQDPNLDKRFFEVFTHPLTGRSIFENLPHSGITHLYISENRLTVEGVAALIASQRLHLLDAGSVDTALSLKHDRPLLSPPGTKFEINTVPGTEKLVPILGAYARHGLTSFRINHTVVTKDAPTKSEKSILELLPELPGDELSVHHFHTELDTSHEIYELTGENDIPVELEDTSISYIPESHINTVATSDQYIDEPFLPRRGSAFAAEVVDTTDEEKLEQDMHPSTSRAQKIKALLAKRPRIGTLPLRQGVSPTIPYLHPSHIPHVETLVLTDVPSHVQANSPILSSLIRFITACSDETLLAKLEARADYSFPPGRDRVKAEQQHARSLFALNCLVLEITPVTRNAAPKALGAWKQQRYGDHTSWKSTTGDNDSERLWSSAMDDFSFFGNEECGVPEPHEEIAFNILNQKVHLDPPSSDDNDSIHSAYSGVSELAGSAASPTLLASPSTISPTSTITTPTRDKSLRKRLQIDSVKARPSTPRSSGLIPVDSNTSPSPTISPDTSVDESAEVDLVSALATFRRTKKNEFEQLQKDINNSSSNNNNNKNKQQRQKLSPNSVHSSSLSSSPSSSRVDSQQLPLHVEGYWPGEVKVIRNSTPKGRSGVVDIYGNYFEKGYLYP